MPVTPALLAALAANATAPSTVVALAGWRVRTQADLPFRRSNCAIASGEEHDHDPSPIAERIAAVEQFYAERGLPARFQIDPLMRPLDLDDVLAARGYEVEAPVHVLTAEAREVAVSTTSGIDVTFPVALDERWIERYSASHGAAAVGADRLSAYRRLLDALDLASIVVTASIEGVESGVALGVIERGWLGIFGMGTAPSARRRGVASALLGGLAGRATTSGAERLYLQVEVDNAAAQRLYRSAGFADAYRYHYRRLGT